MRPLKPEEWGVLGVAVAAVVFGGYQVATSLSANADLTVPQRQPVPDEFSAQARMDLSVAPDGHSHLCQPRDHHAGYKYTPHRYPRTVGGNVSNAIHKGFSSMRIANTNDVQWMISPPSEAAW